MPLANTAPNRGTILVTGGAGYIGAHACKALARAGWMPVAYDDLSTGHASAVKWGPLEHGSLHDRARLDAVMTAHAPQAVMHFAARSDVGESARDPAKYWRDNVAGSLTLLEAMRAGGVDQLVFSSTCAVYGDQDGVTLDESCETRPISAYAASKRAIEDMTRDFGAAHGLRTVTFRYFNVAGADPETEAGEAHDPETHLVPLMLQAVAGERPALTIHGTDYPTPDGTCIRDYVHVSDLVDAHVLGLERLLGGAGSRIYNLGTGTGFSVREVVDASRVVTNRPVPVEEGPRRPGDAVRLVSGSTRAARELGWTPARSTMRQMIGDAWAWHGSQGFDL
jgi:UDP-glucose 4-epimerase